MCKSSTASTSDDGQEKVETSNYGLLNLSSSSMSTPDLGEILFSPHRDRTSHIVVCLQKTKAKETT